MQPIIDHIKTQLDTAELTFTQLADGSSVLLHVESRSVMTLNPSATRLVAHIATHDDTSLNQLVNDLESSVLPGQTIAPDQILQDLTACLQTIDQTLRTAQAND